MFNKDGYVYSQTVRGGHKELKDFVLNESGYRSVGDGFKIKSRVYPREISVKDITGRKKTLRIDEKQVAFYSEDYAKKAKSDRQAALLKARDLVNNPAKYNRATSYGAAKYIKNLVFDKDTGEILTSKQVPIFDEKKLKEEEKFDGFYAIITSELDKSDEEIIEIYRGLWRIEESFKVTKSDLESRPVYLSRIDHIKAHFLICFIALVIARLLAQSLDNRYSIARIVATLKKVMAVPLEENVYIFNHSDEITETIQDKLGINLMHKYLTLGEIKIILGDTKKS
jgi:transposase